ncbi:hypothetical protein [Arcobacter aquimarinus]|uniref:hypothetical protein n=1 Tax=Arcobacter aquimarinus TaxID=1315211 RepID=UPI003BB04388
MSLFKGYILQAELVNKTKITTSNFSQLKVVKKKMGNLSCLLKSSLPDKYKSIAEKECLDLERFWSFSHLSRELGMNEDYICDLARRKSIISIKTNGIRLIKLTDEFIEKLNMGLCPFKIKDDSDKEFARETIDMQGIKIGFY